MMLARKYTNPATNRSIANSEMIIARYSTVSPCGSSLTSCSCTEPRTTSTNPLPVAASLGDRLVTRSPGGLTKAVRLLRIAREIAAAIPRRLAMTESVA